MREILFRGKRKADSKWVEGNLLIDPDLQHYLIIGFNYYSSENGLEREENADSIIPETVGQYTGLTDKNGNKIFEGDIVSFEHDKVIGTDYPFTETKKYRRNYAIEFVNTFNTYGLRFRNKAIHFPCKCSTLRMHDVEVIGNIHDNPKLLEVG